MKTKEQLLLIDTVSKIAKVCLDDDCISWQSQGKSELVLNKIDILLKKRRLPLSAVTSIKVNPGPGSFTGARVGVAVANSLAMSLGIKVNGKNQIAPKYGSPPNINLPLGH